jgi:hypothetical protein
MTTNLRDIRSSAAEHVATDIGHGNLDPTDDDSVETYCHETADGHHDVIYTYAVRELFARGDLDEYLEDVIDVPVPGDIDQALTIAAYYAVRQAYADAIAEYREEHDLESA